MDAPAAADLIQFLEQHGLEIHVDGGWAVDALLGRQTRPHDDLDIALPHAQVPALRALLTNFKEQPTKDNWECNFVLADQQGNRLDVHSYNLETGYGVPYKPEHLTGQGVINGQNVRCIAPEWLVKFHLGYQPDENDRHDVRLLCEHFKIPIPEPYR